jgi:Zn-dependent protease with chaperone function
MNMTGYSIKKYSFFCVIFLFFLLGCSQLILCMPHLAEAESAAVILPPETSRIRTYNLDWYILYFSGEFWGLSGLALFTLTGFGATLRTLIEGRIHQKPFQLTIFFLLFTVIMALWNLPAALIGHHIERIYGFARQSEFSWFTDWLKGHSFDILGLIPVALGFWLIKRYPRRWWLGLWFGCVILLLFSIVLEPIIFDPLFNHFTPLPPSPLRNQIELLARKAGIPHAQILVSDQSRRTTRLNAYVTGLGPSARIVIWDTSLKQLPNDEILAMVGHEMGHYVLHHIWIGYMLATLGALFVLLILFLTLPISIKIFPLARIKGMQDIAVIPLAFLIIQLQLFLMTPIQSAISREIEHQADRWGLQHTGLRVPMAKLFVRFATKDYADTNPPRFIVFWLYGHPPIRERVDFALHGKL